MTDNPSPPPTGTITGSLATARLKALLLIALESPMGQDGETALHSAADASVRLAALGRRVGTSCEGLFEDAAAPTTSVPDLVRLKEAAKALLGKAERPEDREAASLLYHLAVAAAFGRHGLEMSSRPVGDNRERYTRLATHFAGFAIGDIFRRALDRMHKPDHSS